MSVPSGRQQHLQGVSRGTCLQAICLASTIIVIARERADYGVYGSHSPFNQVGRRILASRSLCPPRYNAGRKKKVEQRAVDSIIKECWTCNIINTMRHMGMIINDVSLLKGTEQGRSNGRIRPILAVGTKRIFKEQSFLWPYFKWTYAAFQVRMMVLILYDQQKLVDLWRCPWRPWWSTRW